MSKSQAWQYSFAFMAAFLASALPDLALAAADGGPLGVTLCAAVEWFTGATGAGIATLAVIIIGVGALLGKVSWGMAIIVGLGVAVIFGAPVMIDALSPDAGWSGGC
jgi:type IV secretory pathway VirB2 component (pilin)